MNPVRHIRRLAGVLAGLSWRAGRGGPPPKYPAPPAGASA